MPTPRYLQELAKLNAAFPPGVITHVLVAHDQWCGVNQGRVCDCNPDVSIHADGCPAVTGGACRCESVSNARG